MENVYYGTDRENTQTQTFLPEYWDPIPYTPQSVLTVIYDEDQAASPEQSEPSPTPEPPSRPEQSEPPPTPEPPSSPEQSEPPSTPEPPSSPEQSEPPSSPEQSEPPSSPEQSEPPPTPGKSLLLSDIEQRTGKCMQLRIPLMKSPAVTTETLQTVTEEVLQEGTTFQLSLHQEIPPEVIEKIINELRAEPELRSILTSIEQELGMDMGIDMDIDISDDVRLENELNELENW